MITVRIKGGLGNQLFQYATAYALAKRLGQSLNLDTTFFQAQTLRGYKLGLLNVTYSGIVLDNQIPRKVAFLKNKYINKGLRLANIRCISCGRNMTYLLETRSDIVPEYLSIDKENIYLDGYYQSERYFSQYRKEIMTQFLPNYVQEKEYIDMLRQMEKGDSVAVHVRRGDFMKAQYDRSRSHYLLGEAYYKRALSYMSQHIEKPVFYWFSDDIKWVKENIGDRDDFRFISLSTKQADIDEMMFMKNCHHIIAANSTFSWWAAWLNNDEDAIKIVPAKPYGNTQMIPESWVKIEI